MPIFSVLLLVFIILLLTSNKTRIDKCYYLFTLACTIRIYWFQGYFLKVGNKEILNLAVIAETALSLYIVYLCVIKVIKIKKAL